MVWNAVTNEKFKRDFGVYKLSDGKCSDVE
jgi:hypothetical protein